MSRVLFLIHSLGGGGAERVVALLSRQLSSDHHVAVATLDANTVDAYDIGPNVERLVRQGGQWGPRPDPVTAGSAGVAVADGTTRVRSRGRASKLLGRLANTLARGRVQLAVARLIRSWRADVVIAFVDQTIIHAALAARVPVIGSERSDPRADHRPKLRLLGQRVAYPRLRVMVCQTDQVANHVRRTYGLPDVRVIPNPVELPAAAATPSRSRTVLAVGRMRDCKGHDVVVRAFARIAGDHPAWTLRVLGAGPELERTRKLVGDLGLTGRVDLPGFVHDVGQAQQDAAIYVSGSRREGFPNAMLEAMAVGLPCVVTDCLSGPRELLEGSDGGVLVNVGDVVGLADHLQSLMGDGDLRDAMGLAARGRAADFALDTIAARWSGLVREVLRS